MHHFSDNLATAVTARRSVVCVGLDPTLEGMPPELVEKYRPRVADLGDEGAVAACFQEFCTMSATLATPSFINWSMSPLSLVTWSFRFCAAPVP